MYNVSAAYKAAIKSQLRSDSKVEGTITLENGSKINFSNADIMQGSLEIDNQCVVNEGLEFGSAYVGQLKFKLNTPVDRYTLPQAVIKLSFFLKISDGSFEEVPLGIYIVSQADREGRYLTITAYDNMVKTDEDMEAITNGTPFELLSFIATGSDIELEQDQDTIDEMSPLDKNDNVISYAVPDGEYETYRDLLQDVAAVLCGYATINRFGRLEIRQFQDENGEYNDLPYKTRKTTTVSDYDCLYSGVKITTAAGTFSDKVRDVTNGLNMTIKENKLTSHFSEELSKNLLDYTVKNLKKIRYTPVSLSWTGDPSIEIGDLITVTGGSVGTEYVKTIAMKTAWTFHGAQGIDAVGENPRQFNAKSKNDKGQSSSESTIESIKTKIITYENSGAYKIDDDETLIVNMRLSLNGEATPMFAGTAIIEVTTPGTFDIIYETNKNRDEVFIQKQIAPVAGFYSMAMLYPMRKVLGDGIENQFVVYMRGETAEDGTVAKATITKGHVLATLQSSNIVSENKWNGTFDIYDTVVMYKIAGATLKKLSDRFEAITQYPQKNDMAVSIARIANSTPIIPYGGEETAQSDVIDEYTKYYYDKDNERIGEFVLGDSIAFDNGSWIVKQSSGTITLSNDASGATNIGEMYGAYSAIFTIEI